MRIKLKVLKGASAGKMFEVSVPQFIIGRSSSCQLRPQSDAISRQHCVIQLNEDEVSVRDLGSRNGTIVNGETIEGETVLSTGDEVRVGPLYLKVYVTDDEGAVIKKKAPKKKEAEGQPRIDAKENAGPTRLTSDSGVISDWLLSEDETDKPAGLSSVVTRQFQLDETEQIQLKKAAEENEETKDGKKKGKKKEPGKLPKQAKDQAASSQEAAEKTLRKMFTRGL